MKKLIFISFLFLNTFAFAQRFNSTSYFRTIDYFDKEDSTRNYGIVYRPNEPAKKLLVLLPGFGESPQLAEIETDIPKVAVAQGILTIILSNSDGNLSFQIDQKAQTFLDTIIPFLLNKYQIPNDQYYLGGFSLGGAAVVKYVQHCNVYDITPKPKAVFAIDPPLDFYRLYGVYERWLTDTSSYFTSKQVYITMLEKMRTYFRGDLSNAYQNYLKLSPYCYEDKDKIGVRLFENTIPVRIYCEPDFNWAMDEKHWSAYDLNVIDNVSFINELKKSGNKNAQLILTKDKGFRKILKFKHPHSWSIADASETVKWLLRY